MKTIQKIGKVVKVERKGHSVNGNPSWWVVFELMNGEMHLGYTASDASCGYFVCNGIVGMTFVLTYHMTRAGNIVIDFIDRPKGRYYWDGVRSARTSDNRDTAVISAMMTGGRHWKVYDTFSSEIISK